VTVSLAQTVANNTEPTFIGFLVILLFFFVLKFKFCILMLVGEIVESINCTAEQRRRSSRVSHHQHSTCGCDRYVNMFMIVVINGVWLWCSGQCACWRVRGGTVYVWQRRRAIIHHWSNIKSIIVIFDRFDFCWILGCACWSCCIIEWRTRSQRYISFCFLPHTAILFSSFSLNHCAGAQFRSRWEGATAGGCPNHRTWRNNPQFLLEASQPTTAEVSILLIIRLS